MRRIPINLALFALFCLPLAAQNLTLDKQAAIGRQLAEGIRQHTTPVESPEVRNYVAQLGARMIAFLPTSPSTFSIVSTEDDNSLHEPLVIPGGYIFVPSNLLLTANDEAEFAGMLAQAIARGPLLVQSSAATIPVFISAGGFGGGNNLPFTAIAQQRALELRADKSAALAMSRAGFDPAALLRFIERVQPRDELRSPFPPRATRITALREAIHDIPPVDYAESDKFRNIRELVRPVAPKPRSPPSLLAN